MLWRQVRYQCQKCYGKTVNPPGFVTREIVLSMNNVVTVENCAESENDCLGVLVERPSSVLVAERQRSKCVESCEGETVREIGLSKRLCRIETLCGDVEILNV